MSNGISTESRSKQVSIKNLLTWNRILFSCVYIVHAVHLWGSYTHLKVKWGVIRCGQKNSNISGIISDEIIVFFLLIVIWTSKKIWLIIVLEPKAHQVAQSETCFSLGKVQFNSISERLLYFQEQVKQFLSRTSQIILWGHLPISVLCRFTLT